MTVVPASTDSTGTSWCTRYRACVPGWYTRVHGGTIPSHHTTTSTLNLYDTRGYGRYVQGACGTVHF